MTENTSIPPDPLNAAAAPLPAALTNVRAVVAAQQTMYTSVFDASNDALGVVTFGLKPGMSRTVVVLAEPTPVLAHRVAVEHVKGPKGSFLAYNHMRCLRHMFDKSGAKIDTGAACAGCIALGEEPRIQLLFPVDDLQDPYTPRTGRNGAPPVRVEHPVRIVQVTSPASINQLIDQIQTDTAKGSLAWCVLKASRSQNEKAPRIGDSLTVIKRINGEDYKKQAYWVDVNNALKERDVSKIFALTESQMITALRMHRTLVDRHDPRGGYDVDGMEAVLNGTYQAAASRSVPSTGGDPLASLVGLSEPPKTTRPFKLDDIDDTTPPPASTPAPTHNKLAGGGGSTPLDELWGSKG